MENTQTFICPFSEGDFGDVFQVSFVLNGFYHGTPWKINGWNLQITHLERKMIFQTSIIIVHVNLPGCKSPLNHHLGEYVVFFFPSIEQAIPRIDLDYDVPSFFLGDAMWMCFFLFPCTLCFF